MTAPDALTPDEQKKPWIWQCTRCNHYLVGNPRLCPFCGYTVYRPTFGPEEARS